MSFSLPSVLTIAGSDPSGGAGIQADLKTIAAFSLYGSSVITALTAQNTTKVYLVEDVSIAMLTNQLDAVLSDIPPQAIKIGMAGSPSSIEVIASRLTKFPSIPVVLDPVMVSTSGGTLFDKEGIKNLTKLLFPLATLVTPNIPEAQALLSTKSPLVSNQDMEKAATELWDKYKTSFLLKGGHSDSHSSDVLCHNGSIKWFNGERIQTQNNHGTGCTLTSAIACGLAKGNSLEESILSAKDYINGALMAGLELGKGNGPMWHGYKES
ncbi:bifunctional hydroxymethylpyrimidine kinase/phosphomethylpyrimidine kinase [Lacrimispora sp.]|uniref:bifunctional hydroxymethylpyrimidine kinase/phosphomethylpyrimidine kinase n=1 Tax=Lacrimispora sp. TaxID=2719234 RepID=UPI0028ADFCA9|nr:bifunctional hydroxymethylpyrimidine kinase/phosphomethylpyrimidine kinase [Lacrimispora sp.]